MSDRRLWTNQEDQIVISLVSQLGSKKWTDVAQQMTKLHPGPARTSKQIRERWYNHLDPSIDKKPWSEEEQNIIFDAHKKIGSKWKDIAKLFHAKTDNSVKNHFYSSLRRSLRRINKFLGFKNSTTKMRLLKPSILSKLIQDSDKNEDSRILVHGIFRFSKFKPSKAQRNDSSISTEQKDRYQQAIDSLIKFNEKFEKKQRKTKKPKMKQPNMETKQDDKRNNHPQLLTMTEEISSKQIEKIEILKNINCMEEQIPENKQEFYRQDWQQSSHNFMVEFPELQKPESDQDLMELVCKQQQDFSN